VPTEGALAPDLMRHEAPRDRLVDVPAFRKREPSWKDEVRERVRHRKRYRSEGGDLPLFADRPETAEEASQAPVAEFEPEVPADEAISEPLFAKHSEESPSVEMDDLPLRPQQQMESEEPVFEAPPEAPSGPRLVEWDEPPRAEPLAPWTADDFATPDAPESPQPVERPAYLGERVQAALVDSATIGLVAAVVVYFASRAARVEPLGLLPTWPYVAGFLAFFSLVYASFFTGLTGQTLGKMAFRLRVVDRAGAPPGHARAGLRAALGALGSLALVGVAPVFFDPARRALHDRLLRTRVIRI
jgi:uncharacterized RDD family membrane protein YckC